MPYTTQDIRSTVSRRIYAPMGVWVDVIGEYGDVLAVEYLGERFPCAANKLNDICPAPVLPPPIEADPWKLF